MLQAPVFCGMETNLKAGCFPQGVINAALPSFATVAKTLYHIFIEAQRYLFLRFIYRRATTRFSVLINRFKKCGGRTSLAGRAFASS